MARKGNIVKKSKSSLQLLLIALAAVGWVCTIRTIAVDEEAKAQEELITKAQVYLEDKLYIRAVNQYKTALSDYETEKNRVYEVELLNIYQEAGMQEEYYNLIAERIEKGNAEEEEYLLAAAQYLKKGGTKQALEVLDTGIALFSNEEMVQQKQAIQYEIKYRDILITDCIQPKENWIIPAYDGEKWGYVTQDGTIVLDFIYEEATQFCNGYAVVKLDGVYTLIDKNGYWNAVDKIGLEEVTAISSSFIVGKKNGSCQLYTKTFQEVSQETFEMIYLNDNGLLAAQQNGKWAILDSDLKNVTDYCFTEVAVNSTGSVFTGNYAMVKDESGYYLISADGDAVYEARFVNAKGYEGGLVAVADENGQWGYADSNGELVIAYQYENACSFSSCLGAVEYGGSWGYINCYNQMMIEADYTEAYPFVNAYAIVGTKAGSYRVLTLKYFDWF